MAALNSNITIYKVKYSKSFEAETGKENEIITRNVNAALLISFNGVRIYNFLKENFGIHDRNPSMLFMRLDKISLQRPSSNG